MQAEAKKILVFSFSDLKTVSFWSNLPLKSVAKISKEFTGKLQCQRKQ